MHTLNILVTSLAALAAAAPAPAPGPEPATTPNENHLVARMEDSCSVKGSQPTIGGTPLWGEWRVNIAGGKYYTNESCGIGFLDNFRGRCGVITNWACQYVPDTADVMMQFQASDFCTLGDISAAINAATWGERNVPCTNR